MPTTRDMYNNIKAERARKGWTIEETAEKYGKSEKTLRNWEKNEKKLTSSEVKRFAEIFGCSADYLLGLTDKIYDDVNAS